MASLALGVRFVAASSGTGSFVYASTVPGYHAPNTAPACVDGKTYRLRAESQDLTQWEWVTGVYTLATNTFTRVATAASSNANAAVSFTLPPIVAVVLNPADILQFDDAMSLTVAQKLQALSNLGAIPPQCGKLKFVSTTAISFTPRGGDMIKINSLLYRIPAAGIAGLANTGVFVNGVGASNLAASTLYYVYAFVNSGVVTGDFSITVHGTSSGTGNEGNEVKNGDDTRTLIGMICTNASAQFSDFLTLSWFNRGSKVANTGGSVTTVSAGTNAVATPMIFITWAEEDVHVDLAAWGANSAATYNNAGINIDGVAVPGNSTADTDGTILRMNMSTSSTSTTSDGAHTTGPYCNSGGGALTLNYSHIVRVRG